MSVVQYNFPTRIRFGAGARKELANALSEQDVTRPLFVTDRGIAGLDFFQGMVTDVNGAGLTASVYSDVVGNPSASQVLQGVAAYRTHHADGIVLVGGGAALDVGKTIALMVHHPGEIFDYEDEKPGALPVDQPIPFIVAIPTTAGTGSEVGRATVISDDVTHVKRIIFSPRLLPPLVLSDPEVTVGLPPHVTAATGVDALSHSVEAFLSKGFHPLCDGIALEGIRLVAKNLITCCQEPGNLDARGKMLMASTMGATAFQKGLGVVHSCAHSLSAVTDMHHGLANALMLPACLRFNMQAVPERLSRMANTVGAGNAPEDFLQWMEDLLHAVDITKGLSHAGVQETQFDKLVELALADGCHGCNPRPVSKEDFEALFREAF